MVREPGMRFKFSGGSCRICTMRSTTVGSGGGKGACRARERACKTNRSSGAASFRRFFHFFTQPTEQCRKRAESFWVHWGEVCEPSAQRGSFSDPFSFHSCLLVGTTSKTSQYSC